MKGGAGDPETTVGVRGWLVDCFEGEKADWLRLEGASEGLARLEEWRLFSIV